MYEFFEGVMIILMVFFSLLIIGLSFRWLFLTIIRAPADLKKVFQKKVDNQIDRAFERNPNQTIVEEHNTYNDIKILKKNDINVNL